MLRETKSGCLVNNTFVCYSIDNEDIPVGFVQKKDEIILTDMGLTYNRLLKNGIDLENENFKEYVDKISYNFGIVFNEKKEIIKTIFDEENITMAFSAFIQALILINNINLQLK